MYKSHFYDHLNSWNGQNRATAEVKIIRKKTNRSGSHTGVLVQLKEKALGYPAGMTIWTSEENVTEVE